MADSIRYKMHIRNLGLIKQRQNQYPTYIYSLRKDLIKSDRSKEMQDLKSNISRNNKNINSIKQSINSKNKSINYEDDDYLFDREVEAIQKQMLDRLIKENKELKNKLKEMKNNPIYYKSPQINVNKRSVDRISRKYKIS